MLRRLLRALATGPRPAPVPLDVLDPTAWDEPVDYWPTDDTPTPVDMPPHLLPTTRNEIAYDPGTGALVRVPASTREVADR